MFAPETFSKILIPVAKLLCTKVCERTAPSRCEKYPLPRTSHTTPVLHTYSDLTQINRQKNTLLLFYLVVLVFFFLSF